MQDVAMHPFVPRWGTAVIALPKCASSSVREALKRTDDRYKEVSIREIACNPPEHVLVFVRNPYARLESCFLDKISKHHAEDLGLGFHNGMRFDEFVYTAAADPHANKHFYPQWDALYYEGHFVPTFLGYVETIEETWNHLRHSGFGWFPTLPHINRSHGNGDSPLWSKHLLQLVREAWCNDFKLGYSR